MFPFASALQAFIKEKSPTIDSSNRYFLPLKSLDSLGVEAMSVVLESDLYFIGNPPFSTRVPTPVGV